MYAEIRRHQVEPSSVDEVIRDVREVFLPVISRTPGFADYYVLNAGDGLIVTISVFEDRAMAEESNQEAEDFRKRTLGRAIDPSPGQVTGGEVVLHYAK